MQGISCWRKHYKRWSRRGRCIVKLKACLAHFQAQKESASHLFASWHSLNAVDSWLVCVVNFDQVIPSLCPGPFHLCRQGANFLNLKPLVRAPLTTAFLDQAWSTPGLELYFNSLQSSGHGGELAPVLNFN